ncbi:unnamed protein product [Adineta steineri]|uniref:Uncharacterized protein n=1 Tax=Adineta steineri TaxID=433720 RepID=A0A813W1T5_9BILA|nr:unnamed protein product [Adineta steineri]CAF3922362.1 unnamed protein product [Adineta steineri]
MKQTIISILLILFINQCVSQNGFPKQFQAILNISGLGSWDSPFPGVKQLLYDYDNLRSASQGYAMFNFNPDYPYFTKNDCWYRTNSMLDVGPFPISWLNGVENYIHIYPWYPLPSNLINKGEEWIPELQLKL